MHQERVAHALDTLTTGLYPFVEREMKTAYQDKWCDYARSSFRSERGQAILENKKTNAIRWDAHTILTVMWDQWNKVFRHKMGPTERSLVSELREYRNRWAHQTKFDFEDTYRILDNVERLIKAAQGDDDDWKQLSNDKQDLMRQHFSQEAKAAYRKTQVAKQKWLDTGVYMTCGLSIVLVILQIFPASQAWFFSLVVTLLFSYFSYTRIVTPAPLFFGPHECVACRRIIYGEDCPYCENSTDS